MSPARRAALLAWADAADGLIIEAAAPHVERSAPRE
jgi:DNA-binding transcriptional MocR family regulator